MIQVNATPATSQLAGSPEYVKYAAEVVSDFSVVVVKLFPCNCNAVVTVRVCPCSQVNVCVPDNTPKFNVPMVILNAPANVALFPPSCANVPVAVRLEPSVTVTPAALNRMLFHVIPGVPAVVRVQLALIASVVPVVVIVPASQVIVPFL